VTAFLIRNKYNVLLVCLYLALFFHLVTLAIALSNILPYTILGGFLLIAVLSIDIAALFLLTIYIHRLKSQNILDRIYFRSEIKRQDTYLKYASQIIRHDMNSGINIYIPRGLNGIKRYFKNSDMPKSLKRSLELIDKGLIHTQIIYSGVKEFTELFRGKNHLSFDSHNIKNLLSEFVDNTYYTENVKFIGDFPNLFVNGPLFCIAIDNLIKNGLTYNDSDHKLIKIYVEGDYICIEDNGRGLSKRDYDLYIEPFTRKSSQKEPGTGLGLNICNSILEEHNFDIDIELVNPGTKFKIKIDRKLAND